MNNAEETKQEFIEDIFSEVCNVPEYSSFYLNTFNIIAKLSLQNKAKEERLFDTGDWTDEGQREALITKVKDFLLKYIK
ncbi:hypothetical protein LCGC14_1827190 [marine sediment metagenome]|uniref:Uncharacterized protein n=1 Tax=marine sediment metagenome TaxID=412755 RepID=A0A0F9GH29_9ZZZZ